MDDEEEIPIDDILKSIREAIIEKEQIEYFQSFMPKKTDPSEDGVVLLSKNMLVKRENIPYQSGFWNFNDVAEKMLKKFHVYFHRLYVSGYAKTDRVSVKEDN